MIVVLKVQCLATIKNLSIQVRRFNKNLILQEEIILTQTADIFAEIVSIVTFFLPGAYQLVKAMMTYNVARAKMRTVKVRSLVDALGPLGEQT